MKSIVTGMFLLTSLYLLFIYNLQFVSSAPSNVNTVDLHRTRMHPITRLNTKALNQLIKTKDFGEFIVDDDDLFDLAKRQTSEDYGHLRFGKRDEFDDYGHLRFGRSGSD